MNWNNLTLVAKRALVLNDQNGACICGLSEWRGQKLVLEFEHKNGDNSDNSRSNVEFLCPNCHSLTPTWRGRNKGKGLRISDDDFCNALVKAGSIHAGLRVIGLVPKGGNYKRAHRLVKERNLPVCYPTGTRCATSKLKEEDIIRARYLRDQGITLDKIGKEIGVGRTTIRDALNGKTYKEIYKKTLVNPLGIEPRYPD